MEYPFVVNSSSDGRPALLTAFPELALSYVVVVGVVSVVGTLGNLLVIGTLVSASRPCGCSWPGGMPVTPASRLGRVAGDVFILNLACSDMVITSVINPFAIIGKWFTLKIHNVFPKVTFPPWPNMASHRE